MGTMVDPLPLSDSVLGPAGFHKHASMGYHGDISVLDELF